MKKLITSFLTGVFILLLIIPPTVSAQNNCPAPTGLSAGNATTSSIQLSWTAPAGVAYYHLQYRPVGSLNWTQVNSQQATYLLTNLNCGGIYEWRVQSICVNSGSTSLSSFSAPGVFTILPCNTSCTTPGGLTASNIGINQATISWILVPGVNSYNLRYKPVSATNWIVVNNITSPYQLSNLGCNHHYEFQVQSRCVTSLGTVSVSPWSSSANFLTLACPGSCPAPTGLATTLITSTSAQTSWNAVVGAGSYTVRYRPAGSLAWIYTNTTSPSKLLANLNCNTSYQWQVRANCSTLSNAQINPFSATATFTTLACPSTCLAPTGLAVTNVTATSAQLSWTSTGVNNYRVRYSPSGGGNFTIVNVTGTSTTITGLQPATVYVWQVQSVCANNVFSAWSVLNTFITTSTNTACGIPTGLFASNVSQQGALLNWNPVTGASSYNIRYRHVNSLAWTLTSSTTNSKQIGGITAGMVYEWQVQAVCPTTNGTIVTSLWSPSSIFTTPLLLSVHPNPADYSVEISFESEAANSTQIEIQDLFGTIIYSSVFQAAQGENSFIIGTADLRPGVYNLRVISGNRSISSRLLIQR